MSYTHRHSLYLGFSTREYVVLNEQSVGDMADDDDDNDNDNDNDDGDAPPKDD